MQVHFNTREQPSVFSDERFDPLMYGELMLNSDGVPVVVSNGVCYGPNEVFNCGDTRGAGHIGDNFELVKAARRYGFKIDCPQVEE